MGEYCLVRVYALREGVPVREVEQLAATGLAELLRWVPEVKRLSLLPLEEKTNESTGATERFVLVTRFASRDACLRWRLMEAEGADFWERYASIMLHWEALCHMVEEYSGELALDMPFDEA